MAKRPDFEPWESERGWVVNVPASMSATGKRSRKYFGSETKAKSFAASVRASHGAGLRGAMIPAALALQAAEAARVLELHGVTILEAARAFVARVGTGSAETLKSRYDKMLLENEERWSDRYKLDMDRLPRWVGKDLMASRLCDITPAMLTAALRENGAASQSTLDTRRRYVSAAMNYETKHRKRTHIDIMTAEQVEQMIQACESPEERRAVALLLFAGIRPSAEDGEISRLDWSAVGKTEIYISRAVSKTSDHHIPITPRLRRLLRGHPKTGPAVPANWRRVYARLRGSVVGIAGKQDITRHTFASHYLAAYGEEATKRAVGHTAGSSTLFRHYRAAVTEADGKRYFK
jgi:integrase